MPVTVDEIVEIVDIKGERHEGRAIGSDLVCLENPGGDPFFGRLTKLVRLETTIVCDNDKCEHGEVDDEFHTHPKTISFTEEGNKNNPTFIKELSDVIITSDYAGNKKVFCSSECLSAYTKRQAKQAKVIEMPSGKGTRTFNPTNSPGVTPPENIVEAPKET